MIVNKRTTFSIANTSEPSNTILSQYRLTEEQLKMPLQRTRSVVIKRVEIDGAHNENNSPVLLKITDALGNPLGRRMKYHPAQKDAKERRCHAVLPPKCKQYAPPNIYHREYDDDGLLKFQQNNTVPQLELSEENETYVIDTKSDLDEKYKEKLIGALRAMTLDETQSDKVRKKYEAYIKDIEDGEVTLVPRETIDSLNKSITQTAYDLSKITVTAHGQKDDKKRISFDFTVYYVCVEAPF